MKVLIVLWSLFLCVSTLWGAQGADPAVAAGSSSQPISLSEAIAEALAHNPQVVAARYGVEAADSMAVAARSGLLPQLYLSETINHTNSPLWAFGTKLNQGVIQASDFNPDGLNDPDAVQNFKTALALSWNLYDGGQTRLGWRQARQGQQVSALTLLRTEQRVIADAAKAYVGLLMAGENLEVVEQSLETSRAHLKMVEDRFRSGVSVKSDVLRARVRIADLEQQRLMAHSHVLVTQAGLHTVMGSKAPVPVAPSAVFEKCIALEQEMAQWIEKGLERRPDLKQFDLQQAISDMGVARARSGHLPSVALQGNYEIHSEDFGDTHDNYTVGAVVQVNLYSGRRISSNTAAAKAEAAQMQARRKGLALAVSLEIRQAYYRARSAWQSIEVAHQAVDQAQEGLRIVGHRYAGGLLTIVDLLDSQVALQQARTRHFRAMHDYKVSRIELALAAGTIDKDFR